MIIAEITRNRFSITKARKRSSGVVFNNCAMGSFALPSGIEQVDFPKFAANAIADAIKSRGIAGRAVTLILDDEIIIKEFSHQSASGKHLQTLAELEAEAVLSDERTDYSAVYRRYGNRKNITGELTSVLYLLRNDMLLAFVEAFSTRGLSVSGVYSNTNVYTNAVNHIINSRLAKRMPGNGNFAAIDFSSCKTTISVYQGFRLAGQRSLYSIYSDLLNLIHESGETDEEQAEYLLTSGTYSDQIREKAGVLVSSAINEALRTARSVLDSGRIELSSVILSGSLCSFPLFYNQVVDKLGLPHFSIDDFPKSASRVHISSKCPRPVSDLFLFSGAVVKTPFLADLCEPVNRRMRNKFFNRTNCIILTIIAVLSMCLQPYLYYCSKQTIKADNAQLAQYTEIAALTGKLYSLQQQINAKESLVKSMPFGVSAAGDNISRIVNLLNGKAQLISLSYNGSTGETDISATVGGTEPFFQILKAIKADGHFTVNPNTSVNENADGQYTCTLTLIPVKFKPITAAEGS